LAAAGLFIGAMLILGVIGYAVVATVAS